MESYVEERSVGANSWRCTGVFTFDGNKPIKEKVIYERIRQHKMSINAVFRMEQLSNYVWLATKGVAQLFDTEGLHR